MDIVFFTPEQRTGLSGEPLPSDLMTSATKPIKRPLLEAGLAANADEIDETSTESTVETKAFESTGAWDSYDVWRRFIKEARDRRKGQERN